MAKNFFIHESDDKFGFKTIDNKIIIEPKYDEVKEFIEDYTFVKKDNAWYLIDLNEKIILKCDKLIVFEKENIVFIEDNECFIIWDFDLNKKQKLLYEFISVNQYIILVKENNEFFYLDKNLNLMGNEKFDDAINFNDSFAPVKKNNKWGVVNKNLTLIIDYKYDLINSFSGYLFNVKLDNKSFFIDLKENKYLDKLIESGYNFSETFSDNFISFKYKNKIGIMDEFFEVYFFKKIDKIFNMNNNMAIFVLKNKYGVINKNGKFVIKPIYDFIFYQTDDYFFIKNGRSYNYYSLKEKKLIF